MDDSDRSRPRPRRRRRRRSGRTPVDPDTLASSGAASYGAASSGAASYGAASSAPEASDSVPAASDSVPAASDSVPAPKPPPSRPAGGRKGRGNVPHPDRAGISMSAAMRAREVSRPDG